MSNKSEVLARLREEFDRWEELLSSTSEEQITADQPSSELSIKDVVAHLWGWQQISVARLEAALYNREPEYPSWDVELKASTSDPDEDVDQTNALLFETYRRKPWPEVYAKWRAQFLHFLELSERIPDEDLLNKQKYTWINGYALYDVLLGSYQHHEEHLEELLTQSRDY